MNLEVQDNTTSFIFRYENVDKNLPVDITTATIIISNNSGGVLVTEKTMVILDNVATYDVNFSVNPDNGSWGIARNFKAELKINGRFIPQLFDIVKYPFVNHVKDTDLFQHSPDMKSGSSTQSGNAESGSINTLVDDARIEEDNHWNGGIIEIWGDDNTSDITKHNVLSFISGVITFEPNRTAVIAGDNYSIRKSYQSEINIGGDIVKNDLWKKDLRAYLVLDNYQLNLLIIYKTLEMYYGVRKNSNADDDVYSDRYEFFKSLYSTEYSSIPLNYDKNEDGNLDPDTEEAVGKDIQMNR